MSHTRGGSVEGNVVRKSSKRSRFILGAAVASALAGMTASSVQAVNYSWTGTTSSFWDVNTNWSPNTAFPGGADSVTFGSGPVNMLVDLHAPVAVSQSVNTMVFSNAAGSYQLTNGLLNITGTVTQSGAGTNRISAAVNSSGSWNISAGSLALTNTSNTTANTFNGQTLTIGTGASLTASGGRPGDPERGGSATGDVGETSAINSGNITLNGGTFNARGVLSGQNMLKMSLFPDDSGDQHRYLNEGPGTTWNTGASLLTRTPAGQREMAGILAYSDLPQGSPFVDIRTVSRSAITDHDNLSVLVSGKLNVSAADAGDWIFGTRSDDGSVVWIDLNHNGIFENTGDPATTELIVDNNAYQGPTLASNNSATVPNDGNRASQGHPNLTLAAGSYDIAIGWYEGGWTGDVAVGFINATHPGDATVESGYTLINPSDASSGSAGTGQTGMWSFDNSTANLKYDAKYTNSDVTVSAATNSTINVDAVSAEFRNLTIGNGATLNVTGPKAKFATTAVSGTVTINNSADVLTGPVSNGGGTITRINKLGSGTLQMTDMTTASGFSAASSISVQAGKLHTMADTTTSTVSGATIRLEGGKFVAQGTSGGNGLYARYYNGPNGPGVIDPITNLTANTPAATGVLVNNIDFRGGDGSLPASVPSIIDESGGILGGDNFSVLWSGRLNVSAANAGLYRFVTGSDDGSVIWIDLNHNGVFEYNDDLTKNELIVNNNVYQGRTFRSNNNTGVFNGHRGHPALTLAAGSYDVAIAWYEGGGDSNMTAIIQSPATGGLEQLINPSAQPGLWTYADPNGTEANYSTSNVVVTQDGTIEVQATRATFGALTVDAGKTLTIAGNGGARFSSSTISGAFGIVTDPDGISADAALGRIINGGGLTGITKSGGAALILDDTSAASALTAAMSINVTSGSLVATTDGVNNPLGGASVTLANGTGITLGSKAAGPVTFANSVNASGTVRVAAANRGTAAVDNGSVTLGTLNVPDGGRVNLAANNGYFLTIAQNNLAGNATYDNSSSDNIALGNVSGAASSVVNVNGNNRTRITGNVVANNIIVSSAGLDLDPAGGTKTIAANTHVNTEMRILPGVIDYGLNVISGNSVQAGLFEGRVLNGGQPDRNINKVAINPRTGVTLNLRRINQGNVNTDAGENTGWLTDSTYIYTGQIYIPDNDIPGDGVGKVAFGENFDDYTQVKVDGALVIDDAGWNVASTSGSLPLAAGWHDIEFRGGQGVGGVGPVTGDGWGDTKAIGVDFNATGSTNGADYVLPADDGTMNLFRTVVSTVNVQSGAELKVGGLTNVGINLNGGAALSKLTLANHASASSSDAVSIKLLGTGATGEVNVGSNTTLTAGDLLIDSSGSTLTKTGPGLLRISKSSNLQSTVVISAGKMQFNGTGTGPGGVNVLSGATLGGSGTIAGAVNVETGGIVSPHDGTGVATLTLGSLVLNSSILDFNFGTFGDSANVLTNLTLGGNSTLNLNAIPGEFTVGTYRLFTMAGFTDTGDVILGTNNGPAAFNYSIVETAPVGATPGHIDLIVTSQVLKWSGTTNNVWDINNTVNWQNTVPAPAKYIDLSSVVFDNTGNNRTINITASSVNPSSITVDNDAAHAYSIGGNPIGGPTGILKQGVGTLTLTGSNTYVGPVIVEAGVLEVNTLANAGSPSALGSGVVPVTLGTASTSATLRYTGGGAGSTDRGLTIGTAGATVDTGTQNATFGGIVSGDGTITKVGSGTLALPGLTNTMTGSLTVNSGTLSVGSVGIAAAPAAINLSAGTTFEYTGGNHTGGRAVNVSGGAGTIRVTNASTNLSLGGPVSGPTLSKAGPGTLTLSGPVAFTGTTHNVAANGGTVVYTGTGNTISGTYGVDAGSTLRTTTTTGIGNVTVALNGGTLSLRAPTTAVGGLIGEFYQFGPNTGTLASIDALNTALASNAGSLYAIANTNTSENDPRPEVRGAINHIAGGGNPFDQYTDAGGTVVSAPGGFDNLVTRWTGKLNITAAQAGLIEFFTASDDGSKLWIDGVEVVNNNFFQGTTERGGSINLTEGAHDVVIGFYEGGGDASMIWRWTPVGGIKQVVPNNVLGVNGPVAYGNNVSLAAGATSTIDSSGGGVSVLGALNMGNNSTLNVTSLGTSGSGHVSFTGTTLATAGGTYNTGSVWDINLGQVTGTGTLNHTNKGAMILETSNLAGLGAGSVININGGTLGAVGDAAMTSPLGQASVNLADGTSMVVGSRTGDAIINNAVSVTGAAGVSSGIIGSATVGPHTLTLGSAARPLGLAAGATANLGANNGTSLVIPAVQLAGDGNLNNNSSSDSVTIGNISATGGTATFGGSKQMRLTGNITGVVTNVVVNNGALNVDPGAAGTSNINGPMKVLTTLNANSGITNFGNNIVSGRGSAFQAGLLETFADGSYYDGPVATAPNAWGIPQTVQLEPRRANQPAGDTNQAPPGQGGVNAPGWRDDTTYIYSGQIFVPDNEVAGDGVGHVAFGMRFDDIVALKIDGQLVMRDFNWNNATSSGELVLKAGWHDIDMRFGEGGGGVGPNSGAWPATFADGTPAAIGYQTNAALGFDPSTAFDEGGGGADITKYFAPRDNGSMNMFRVSVPEPVGTINLASGATVNAGGLADVLSLTLNGSTVNLNSSAAHSGSVVTANANGSAGTNNTINLGANNTLTINQLVVASGTIFNKNGAGTLRLSEVPPLLNANVNVNDFGSGSEVHINAGKMIINTPGGTGTGSVFVAGSATLGGSGSITGAVTVASSGHVAPGESVGTLKVGGLSLDSSILDIEGSVAGFDKIWVNSPGSSDATIFGGDSTINLFDLGGVAAGTNDYIIIDYNNTTPIADALTHLHLGTTPAGWTALLVNDTVNQDIVLHLTTTPGGNPQWNVDSDGSWGLASNWQPATVPDGSSVTAGFLGKITAARTVSLDGNRTVQNLNFDNANKYTIASGTGGTLTLAGGGGVTVTAAPAGGHEISAPVALSGINTINTSGPLILSGGLSIGAGGATTKTGPAALTISGAQGHGPGSALTVNRGVLNLNSNAGTAGSAAASPLALNITGGGGGTGRVNLGSSQDLAALNVAVADAGTQTLDLASPATAGGFNSVTVYAANLAAAKAALYNAIANANAAGVADPLDGIVDSGLHANSKIGLAQSGDHISIRSTRIGDLNLDGNVTISDFIDLASNFGSTGGISTWQEGDLNYDKNVTISDFIDLAANFGASYSGSAVVTPNDVQTLASFASSVGVDPSVIGSAVPEPGTMSLLAIGALGLMGRRRRSRKA